MGSYLLSSRGKHVKSMVEKCEAFEASEGRLPYAYEKPDTPEKVYERKLRVFIDDFVREQKNDPEADALQKRILVLTEKHPLNEYNTAKYGVELKKDLLDLRAYCEELEEFPIKLKAPASETEVRAKALKQKMDYYALFCTPSDSTLMENDLRLIAKKQILLYKDVYSKIFVQTNKYIKQLEEMLKLFIKKQDTTLLQQQLILASPLRINFIKCCTAQLFLTTKMIQL